MQGWADMVGGGGWVKNKCPSVPALGFAEVFCIFQVCPRRTASVSEPWEHVGRVLCAKVAAGSQSLPVQGWKGNGACENVKT